jgi:hypothetical protein
VTAEAHVLRAVADGEQKITSQDVLDLYRLNSSSAAAHGIDGLRRDALRAPGKPFRVSDPFIVAWVGEPDATGAGVPAGRSRRHHGKPLAHR